MRYAFFPGCVSRGGAPELYQSTIAVAGRIGIELEEIEGWSCTGAGALQESNPLLGDTLNARNFALAQRMGLPIMTICSTCQGVMAQAKVRLEDDEYRAQINELLAEEDLEYTGGIQVKHMLWIMVEDIGLDHIKSLAVKSLDGVFLAPFYGCYIVALELVIEALGATAVDNDGKTRCCGFPILTINERNSLAMVAKHTGEAQDLGADAMVTPCPLCHLNLDGFQSKAARQVGKQINVPILHLPQLIGAALGLDGPTLGLNRHIVSSFDVALKMGLRV